MRTVLYRIHLFNDLLRHGHHIYVKRKERERVQESGEKEKERVCERWRVAERGGSINCKMGCWKNVMGEIRRGL